MRTIKQEEAYELESAYVLVKYLPPTSSIVFSTKLLSNAFCGGTKYKWFITIRGGSGIYLLPELWYKPKQSAVLA